MFARVCYPRVVFLSLGATFAAVLAILLCVAFFKGGTEIQQLLKDPFEVCFQQEKRIAVSNLSTPNFSNNNVNKPFKPPVVTFNFNSENPDSTSTDLISSNTTVLNTNSNSSNCAKKLNLTEEDPQLTNYLRRHRHLFPPSSLSTPYNLSGTGTATGDTASSSSLTSTSTSTSGKNKKIWRNLVYPHILDALGYEELENGIFIEAGAHDGEYLSNTLALEMYYGWTGLLVEMNPVLFKKLQMKKRKSWLSNVCLSSGVYPYKAEIGHSEFESFHVDFEAECFPLFTVLSAIGVTSVDYFSLNLDGAELGVLQSIPFDTKILIRVFSISVTPFTLASINNFMISKGYHVRSYVRDGPMNYQIYVHRTEIPPYLR